MEQWYFANLGDGMTATDPEEEIQAVFARAFSAQGEPSDMAIFTRHESGRLHCEVIAYFSPATESIAKLFDAEPCAKPLRAGLGLLAGDESAWQRLFAQEAN